MGLKNTLDTYTGVGYKGSMKIKLLLIALLLPVLAPAEEITLQWTDPVTNEDGSPLTNLAGVRIWKLVADLDPGLMELVVPGLLPGEHVFVGTAYNTLGVESKISNTVEKTSTGFFAPAGTTVNMVTSIDGGFLLVPIGTVATDTPCSPNQSVNGLHAVPTAAVTWAPGSTARPLVVVAECQ